MSKTIREIVGTSLEDFLKIPLGTYTVESDQEVKKYVEKVLAWTQKCHVRWNFAPASMEFILREALKSTKITLAGKVRELSQAGAKELFGNPEKPYNITLPDIAVEDPKAKMNRTKSGLKEQFDACKTLAEAEAVSEELGLSGLVPEPWASRLK